MHNPHTSAHKAHRERVDWIMAGLVIAASTSVLEAILTCGLIYCSPVIEHDVHNLGMFGLIIASVVAIYDHHQHKGH